MDTYYNLCISKSYVLQWIFYYVLAQHFTSSLFVTDIISSKIMDFNENRNDSLLQKQTYKEFYFCKNRNLY